MNTDGVDSRSGGPFAASGCGGLTGALGVEPAAGHAPLGPGKPSARDTVKLSPEAQLHARALEALLHAEREVEVRMEKILAARQFLAAGLHVDPAVIEETAVHVEHVVLPADCGAAPRSAGACASPDAVQAYH